MSFAIDEKLQRALDLGYAYVNRRERTVSEVRAQLERKGVSIELIDAAVQTLAEQGFLDDERFAWLFVSDKRELEQWGSERIRRGLLARGVDRELAERALAPGSGPRAADGGDAGDDEEPSELDRALELLRRRFPAPPRERRERDRALGVLLRKGYESEVAIDALTAYAHDADH
jgi:regulatory protein